MKNHNGSSEIRKGRTSLKNHIYHITFTTKRRACIFSEFETSNLLRKCIKQSDEAGHSNTLAYCIMPDHIHWLFELKSGSLSQAVARVKASYSRLSGTKTWQDGFHDHAIRSDESLINVARYIAANPLRANLVKDIGQYPYWDSIWLE